MKAIQSNVGGRSARASRMRRMVARVLAAAGLLAMSGPVLGVSVTWDASTGTGGIQDGGGNWINGGTNWHNGVGNVGWTSAPTPDTAIFGAGSGAAGTVTLTGPITVDDITFNAPGSGNYLITGNTLTMAGAGTPTITANVNATINSVVAGAAGLTKAGTGVLSLGTNNTYTGATTISAGTLEVLGTYATSSYSIASGAVLELDTGAANKSYSTTSFSGAGTLLKTGTSQALWGATAATFSLTSGSLIDIQQGQFVGGSSANEVWTNNFSDLNIAAGAEFTGVEANVRVDALTGAGTLRTGFSGAGYVNFTIGVDNGTGNFSGTITNASATGNLVKVGTGTQTLSNANTYTGTTTVNAGTLNLSHALALQNSALVTTGAGTITLTGVTTPTFGGLSGATGNLATIISSGYGGVTNLTLNPNAGSVVYGGVIADGAAGMSVTKTGAGTQILSGANTYTGATIVNAGTLQLGNGGTTGSLSTASALVFAANTNFEINQSDTVTQGVDFSGAAFTGNVNLIKSGTGNLVLTGNNTVRELRINNATGFVDIGSGNLFINNGGGNTISSTTGGTINGTGTITLGTGGGVNFGDNSSNSGTLLTINPRVTGANGFEYCCAAGGTIFLANNANDFAGPVFINSGGTIRVSTINNSGVAGGLGLGSQINLNTNGANLEYVGTASSTNRNIVLGNNFSNSITQSGASGNLLFNGTFTGGTGTKTLTLQGSTAGTGEIASNIGDGSAGTQAIVKSGTGTWILSGANTYSGTTTVNSGILLAANSGALGTNANGTRVLSGATLQLAGNIATSEGLALAGTGVGGIGALTSAGNNSVGPITLQDSTLISSTLAGTTLTINGNIDKQTQGDLTFGGAGNTVLNGTLANGAIPIAFSNVNGRLFHNQTGLGIDNEVGIDNVAFINAPTQIDPLAGNMSFVNDTEFTNFFGASQPGGTNFTAAFVGDMTIGLAGTYFFGTTNNDDLATVWIDLNGNGTFEAGELIRNNGCCNNTGVSTAALPVGTRKFAYAVQDTGGGSGLVGRFDLPLISGFAAPTNSSTLRIVNPSFSFGGSNLLTKNGGGTLTLNGVTNAAGGIIVNGGTLNTVGAPSVNAPTLVIGTGAKLEALALNIADVTLSAGSTVSPGGDGVVGTLAINGNLDVGNNVTYNWDYSLLGNDMITLTGDLSFLGSNVNLVINSTDGSELADNGLFVLFEYDGALLSSIPSFNISFTPGTEHNYDPRIIHDAANNRILLQAFVPEPATVSLLMLGGAGLLGRRRRREM